MSTHSASPHPGQGRDIVHGVLSIPLGWKRDLINGRVVYVTPSNCLLWSLDEVAGYLLSDGTCKCGLDCPLVIHQVFNFDPCTCFQNSPFMDAPHVTSNQNLCNHRRRMNATLEQFHQSEYQKAQDLERMYRQSSVISDGMANASEGIMAPLNPTPPVHYNLIVPQTILMSSSREQMILGSHVGMPPYPSMNHPQSQPFFQSRKRVRRRSKSKMKTVAAILKMKS